MLQPISSLLAVYLLTLTGAVHALGNYSEDVLKIYSKNPDATFMFEGKGSITVSPSHTGLLQREVGKPFQQTGLLVYRDGQGVLQLDSQFQFECIHFPAEFMKRKGDKLVQMQIHWLKERHNFTPSFVLSCYLSDKDKARYAKKMKFGKHGFEFGRYDLKDGTRFFHHLNKAGALFMYL